MHTQWLDVGGHGTTTRFELPMDILLLERMSPLQYLRAHCIIRFVCWVSTLNVHAVFTHSNHRLSLCSKVFTKLDKDRDGYLSRQVTPIMVTTHGVLGQYTGGRGGSTRGNVWLPVSISGTTLTGISALLTGDYS